MKKTIFFLSISCLLAILTHEISAQTPSNPNNQNCRTNQCQSLVGHQKTVNWRTSTDGTASASPYWNNRKPIESPSRANGCFVLHPTTTPSSPANDTLRLPTFAKITPDKTRKLYISFHQYYRNYENATTTLQYSLNGGTTWETKSLNTDIPNFYETARYKKVIVPIIINNNAPSVEITVRFLSSGKLFFWLIDDVSVCNEYPSNTLPNPEWGKFLAEKGYPYEVDANGFPYVPRQAIIKFNPDVTEAQKDELRKANNISCYATCICDSLENWEITYPILQGAENENHSVAMETENQNVPVVNSIATRNSETNYYALGAPEVLPPCKSDVSQAYRVGKPNQDKISVAILDTGSDLQTSVSGRLFPYINSNEKGNDEDGNCLKGDFRGYNFVDETKECALGSNSINDNNGHGSHVLGIVDRSLSAIKAAPAANYLTVKVLDENGVGTVFSTACGVYYAAQQKVNVINCSWGYYSDSLRNSIMLDAIRYANRQKSLLVCSAGNESSLIASPHLHLPSSYREPNVVAVSAMRTYEKEKKYDKKLISASRAGTYVDLHTTSNYSTSYVDIGAFGYNILSNDCFRGSGQGVTHKSGTSMAAPVVSAAALYYYAQLGITATPAAVKAQLLGTTPANERKYLKIERGQIFIVN